MVIDIGRREFITLLGGAVATWPLAARAQKVAMPVIGFLGSSTPEYDRKAMEGFRRGLSETSYVEGRNVVIEDREAQGQYDRMPALVADLINRGVTILIVSSLSGAFAAKAATTSIPIVFMSGGDPVQSGLVKSLNRPGGNLTGVSMMTIELVPKRLQIMRDLTPGAAIIGMLVNPTARSTASAKAEASEAAQTLGLQIHFLETGTEGELADAFTTLVGQRINAVIVTPDPFFNDRRAQLIELAQRHSVPVMYPYSEFVTAGGLISYGINRFDLYRQMGLYAARILKGEKPADLPVMQPTKFEMVINQTTAKALGLTIPPSVLAVADEVIE
jgi:putative tryptophan/tyrosine transport system substrate-binding protein